MEDRHSPQTSDDEPQKLAKRGRGISFDNIVSVAQYFGGAHSGSGTGGRPATQLVGSGSTCGIGPPGPRQDKFAMALWLAIGLVFFACLGSV